VCCAEQEPSPRHQQRAHSLWVASPSVVARNPVGRSPRGSTMSCLGPPESCAMGTTPARMTGGAYAMHERRRRPTTNGSLSTRLRRTGRRHAVHRTRPVRCDAQGMCALEPEELRLSEGRSARLFSVSVHAPSGGAPAAMYSTTLMPKCSSRMECSPATALPSTWTSCPCSTPTRNSTDPDTPCARPHPPSRPSVPISQRGTTAAGWSSAPYARPCGRCCMCGGGASSRGPRAATPRTSS
jgi:hypothetical protein